MVTVGKTIEGLIERNGIDEGELADYVGISRRKIRDYQRNNKISKAHAELLARALGVKVEDITEEE